MVLWHAEAKTVATEDNGIARLLPENGCCRKGGEKEQDIERVVKAHSGPILSPAGQSAQGNSVLATLLVQAGITDRIWASGVGE